MRSEMKQIAIKNGHTRPIFAANFPMIALG